MRKFTAFLHCAACAFAASTIASAGAFNPEIKPLGSLSKIQSGTEVNQTVIVGNADIPMNRLTAGDKEGYVECSVLSRGGTIESVGRLTVAKSPSKAESEVSVEITVLPVEGYEVVTYGIGIIDETTMSTAAEIKADETTHVLPASSTATLDVSNSFAAVAYGELLKDGEVKAVAYYTSIEVVDGVAKVTVDFNESTRLLAFQAYMGNGEPFPEYKPWSEGCGYNITYGSQLAYSGYYANFKVDNPMTFYVHCNEFPGSSYYSISYSANLFDSQVYCSLAGGSSLRDFANQQTMVECIPAEFYNNLSFSMSLSPADRAIGRETLISASKTDVATIMENGKFGLQTNTLDMCFNDPTRQPVDSYNFYAWVPTTTIGTGIWTSMIYTGFAAYDEKSSKYCGARTSIKGVEYILPWEQNWNEAYETYTPFSSISQFNIKPSRQDLKNFYFPLFAISNITIKVDDTTNKLSSATYNAHYYGMFHEKMNYSGVDIVKSFKIDGEEKAFSEITNVALDAQHSFDLTFYNPDGFVQGQFPTESLNTLHFSSADINDMVPPKLIGLQMYDSRGRIKTSFKTDEKCNFLVAMYDRTSDNTPSLDFDVKLFVAAQDADEWIEIADPETTDYDAKLGKTFEFLIPTNGTLAPNKWLKLKIEGKDTAGNTNTMLLDYCLFIDDPTAIDEINTDSAEAAPIYYNLQGIRVENPSAGDILIERRGAMSKVVIK